MLPKENRVPLAHLPTPLGELPRLSRALGGPRLWIKRDDLTGLAGGGNKARKLEFFLADALEQRATTLITTGAPQSNHALQTAAAAARYGLQCVLVLRGIMPPALTGNLLLDRLVGARIRWTGDRDRNEVMEEVAEEERAAGRRPYIVPYGGSNALGASAYVLAMEELARQAAQQGLHFDHIVFASSSGGTQAGLVVGARAVNFAGRILGVSVDQPEERLRATVLDLARLAIAHLQFRFEITPDEVLVNDRYRGEGYAIMGEPEREAILLAAQTEGLLVDPLYTGRALAGLIDLVRKGGFSRQETVLFWHTGGIPALFAYTNQLLSP